MKLLSIYDQMLQGFRPVTKSELLEIQKKCWSHATDCDVDTVFSRKSYDERLQIRQALANHTNMLQPPWVAIGQKK